MVTETNNVYISVKIILLVTPIIKMNSPSSSKDSDFDR